MNKYKKNRSRSMMIYNNKIKMIQKKFKNKTI